MSRGGICRIPGLSIICLSTNDPYS
jgi:hypothetical protein